MGDQAKPLLPFLQRADEMAKADPKVAYYCRLYAVEEGMKIPDKSPELGEMLSLLVRQLEATKQAAGLLGAEDDEAHVENFALKIFAKADRLDRAGRSDAKTAKMLYVSSVFLEVLRQWNELSDDLASKQRYAAWRAGELSSAAREGRAPPPPPNTDEDAAAAGAVGDVSETAGGSTGSAGPPPGVPTGEAPARGAPPGVPTGSAPNTGSAPITGSAPTPSPPPPSYLSPGTTTNPTSPSPYPSDAPPPPAAWTPPSAPPSAPHSAPRAVGVPSPPANLPPVSYGDGIGIEHVAEAQKHAKFAVSALGFEDVPTAVDNLRRALALLTGRAEP